MAEEQNSLAVGKAIYARSFAIIRAEADLTGFSPEQAEVVIRMIHACALVDLAGWVLFDRYLVPAARTALASGSPILCDSEMLAHGITRARLPAANQVICTLRDPRVPALAAARNTTRSAAALELWDLKDAIIAIGNAPTALCRLLDMLDAGVPKPAAIIGIPVGFVGAAEAKSALAANPRGVPFLTVRGRLGGSAFAAAAINALARPGI